MYVPTPPAPNTPAATAIAPLGRTLTPDAESSLESAAMTEPIATRLVVRRRALDVLDGQHASVTGTLRAGISPTALAGRTVSLQAFSGGRWNTVAGARTARTGFFRLRFWPHRVGTEIVRLRFAGDPALRASRRFLGRLNVYRSVQASWYGGGGSLACGGSLSSGTMGVASRTLPCGTLVTLRFDGRSVRVPVIDRGPYVEGREFDLTEATRDALGFGDTGAVWSTS
jgi:rare lipoprotein A